MPAPLDTRVACPHVAPRAAMGIRAAVCLAQRPAPGQQGRSCCCKSHPGCCSADSSPSVGSPQPTAMLPRSLQASAGLQARPGKPSCKQHTLYSCQQDRHSSDQNQALGHGKLCNLISRQLF